MKIFTLFLNATAMYSFVEDTQLNFHRSIYNKVNINMQFPANQQTESAL